MTFSPSYVGPFCLLHLNEADAEFLDKGPGRRNVGSAGFLFTNPFDGPFEDLLEGGPSGCAEFPQDPPPGETSASNLISLSCGDQLSWQNEKFTIEFWFKVFELPDGSYDMTISSMGGLSEDPNWILEVRKDETGPDYQVVFIWKDIVGVNKSQRFPLTVDLLNIQTWQHFAFAYGDTAQSFDYWIDGVSRGPFLGVANENEGPWSGVNIIQTGEPSNVLTIGNVHPGGREDNATSGRPNVFKGQMAEYRLMSGQLPYPLGEDFTPRTEAYADYDPTDPIQEEEIVIERAFVNGLSKIYIESKQFPMLTKIHTINPSEASGLSEGETYFYRPNPQRPELFLYLWININGEGEDPVYRWVPYSGVVKGQINPVTGNKWNSRRGNTPGEIF